VHHNRDRIVQTRNYIEELTGRIEEGKKAGKPMEELQKTLTAASIKTLNVNGYSKYVQDNLEKFTVYFGHKTPLEDRVSGNIEAIYRNLDRV
jgi:hypothetical protein